MYEKIQIVIHIYIFIEICKYADKSVNANIALKNCRQMSKCVHKSVSMDILLEVHFDIIFMAEKHFAPRPENTDKSWLFTLCSKAVYQFSNVCGCLYNSGYVACLQTAVWHHA